MRLCATTLESELRPDERAALLKTLRMHHFSGKHLEIGTAAGGTLWEMMRCFSDQQRPPFVVIDPMKYFPQQHEAVRNNLSSHNIDSYTVDFRIAKSSVAFSKAESENERFDFIFIDGNHKHRYVVKDLLWSRLLNIGGLLCLHDFSPKYPGVWTTVRRFLKKHPNYQKIDQVNTLLILKKIEQSPCKEVTKWDLCVAEICSPVHQIIGSIKKNLKKLSSVSRRFSPPQPTLKDH